MKILKTGTTLYRGGACKNGNAFYALNPQVAKMYGTLCAYEAKRPLKLFVLTHTSLKQVFKYLSKDLQLLMSFTFGTGLLRKNQEITLKRIQGVATPLSTSRNGRTPGQRLSVTEIDTIAIQSFGREFLNRHGYDGVYMPRKKSKFHRGVFHSELFISKSGLLLPLKKKSEVPSPSPSPSSSRRIPDLFIQYTKHTKALLKPHPSQFVMYLSGGMAVKLYLQARGIRSTVQTSDFDFKFAVPRVLRTKTQIEKYSNMMRRIMYRHVSGFVRFLNRNGIQARLEFKEVQGVPLDKPGGFKDPLKKRVYKVYNYTIVTANNVRHELVDTSLVMVPGITREYISLKWSRIFGMPIQTLYRLWKDTLYILAGSFVIDTIKLRNPIDGAKKEKGIKNSIRTGHLSFLTARKRGTARLVNLSRRLITNVIRRNKPSGIKHSKQILKKLKSDTLRNLLRKRH